MDAAITNWQHARKLLPFKDVTEEDVLDRLLTGRAHLWVSPDSAGVTEVTDGNMLHIWLSGGTLRGLLQMLPDVETFAKALGCRGVELTGRKGWQRIFSRFGFVCEGQVMVKYNGR